MTSRNKVQCPCCKGRKWLAVHYLPGEQARAEPCCHCMGEGDVEALLENDSMDQRVVPRW